METVLVYAGRASEEWCQRLATAAPEFRWLSDVEHPQATAATVFVGWNPPPGWLAGLPRLRLVHALGAGVDGFLARTDLPPEVPVLRLLDAGMAEQMTEYALLGVLMWQRRLPLYRQQQMQARWKPWPPRPRGEVRVSVLGLGRIGGQVATALAGLGYRVAGWSRSARTLDGVATRHGTQGLDALLTETDVLVSVLPSTAETRGLLDRARLARLPQGAMVVSAGRGDQLVTRDLLALLDEGHLAAALLDVFETEPLPPESPLWRHPAVILTPHVAALTVPEPAVRQVVTHLRRWLRGETLPAVVDRRRGY